MDCIMTDATSDRRVASKIRFGSVPCVMTWSPGVTEHRKVRLAVEMTEKVYTNRAGRNSSPRSWRRALLC